RSAWLGQPRRTPATTASWNKKMTRKLVALMGWTACLGFLSASDLARGDFIIDLQAQSSLASNAEAVAAFQMAAARWQSIFSDNVTVRIEADFRDLGANRLGQAGSFLFGATYATARSALIADAAGYPDNAIL